MKLSLATGFLLACAPAAAQQTSPQPPRQPAFGCPAAEAHQFDFWVGTWNVFDPAGQLVGTNTIESVEAGCALQETWQGARGSTGRSLNFFEAGAWHQLWVANAPGGVLRLTGGVRNGAMIMTGTSSGPQGTTVHNRITWTPLPNGEVRQHWETSPDGTAWQTAFDGRYVRRR